MALKFNNKAKNGSSGQGTYDHNLLVNRGLPDQHPIESITGLREALNRKYEKPFSGIPKTDLAFDVVTRHDLDTFRNTEILNISNDLTMLALEILEARGDKTTLKEYIDTKVSYDYWSGNGGVGHNGGAQVGYPLYEVHSASEEQTLFSLTKTFQKGTHQLEVYLNGIRMIEDDDYIEVDDHTIQFLFPLEKDDKVLFMVRSIIYSGLHEEFIATEGQTSFILSNPYAIYENRLQVYRNGVLKRKGRDYQEINNHRVDFLYPLKEGDLITFHQAGATDPIAGTIMESEIGRIKINQAYQMMNIVKALNISQTDYVDMYIDTFINDTNIDKERSLTYLHKDDGIYPTSTWLTANTFEKYQNALFSGVDIETYRDRIILSNSSGGSEINSFNTYEAVFDENIIYDNTVVLTNKRCEVHLASIQMPAGYTELQAKVYNEQGTNTYTIQSTDGLFLGINAVSDIYGRIHIVYHEQGSSFGVARVFYTVLDSNGTLISQQCVSDESFDSIAPDIAILDDTVYIVFSSKRVHSNVFNIDYITIKNNIKSGIQGLTLNSTHESLNPSIDVGKDAVVHIVFETKAYNGTHKNIQYLQMKDDIITYSSYITEEDFDNVTPHIAIDSKNVARIVWRSKRLSANYGVDYCAIVNRSKTMVKSVMEGTITLNFGSPRIYIDYEDIAHIVVHANEKIKDKNSILYTTIYPDHSITPYENIAYDMTLSFNDPDIFIVGDTIAVSFYDGKMAYRIHKSLANYNTFGQFSIIFDSRSEDSIWNEIKINAITPEDTNIEVDYRLSNDRTIWTSWKSQDKLIHEYNTGRYIQISIKLHSSNHLSTPEVLSINAFCEPLWTEIYSVPKPSTKTVTSAIVIGKYEGNVEFFISRDNGKTFLPAQIETSVNLSATPDGRDVVICARIKKDSHLISWGVVW